MSYDCIGVVLAGGKSSRMGTDKAQLLRGQQPMLAFCEQLLSECGVKEIRISRNIEQGIRDVFPECGPLGGIYSSIRDLNNTAVLILPVDMPLLNAEDLRQLIAQGERFKVPTYYQDCYLPLYLPVNEQVIDYLHQQLSHNGNLKVRGLAEQFGGRALPSLGLANLINTNTPQQWLQSQPFFTSRG